MIRAFFAIHPYQTNCEDVDPPFCLAENSLLYKDELPYLEEGVFLTSIGNRCVVSMAMQGVR